MLQSKAQSTGQVLCETEILFVLSGDAAIPRIHSSRVVPESHL